jgi:hypothetical protein
MPAIGFERLKEYNSQSDLKMIDFCTQNAESEIALVETPILPPVAPHRNPDRPYSILVDSVTEQRAEILAHAEFFELSFSRCHTRPRKRSPLFKLAPTLRQALPQAPELPGVQFGTEHYHHLPPLAGDHPGRTPGAGLSATGQLHIGEFSGCLFEQREMNGRAYRRHVMLRAFQILARGGTGIENQRRLIGLAGQFQQVFTDRFEKLRERLPIRARALI